MGDVRTYEVEGFSRDEIIAFAKVWDPQRLHIDEAYAKEIHGSLIASGFQTMLHVMQPIMAEMMTEVENIAGLGFDNLRWPRPVRPNEALTVLVEITEVRPSQTKPDRGVLTYYVEARNGDDDVVFCVDTPVMLKRRPQEGS